MTAQKAGALRDNAEKWSSINWKEAQREVRRLQMRIAKAVNNTVGLPHKGCLLRCLSCMRGNSHVQFLGGKGAERPLTYPIYKRETDMKSCTSKLSHGMVKKRSSKSLRQNYPPLPSFVFYFPRWPGRQNGI